MTYVSFAARSRIFFCWPSRMAALALCTLALTWGGEALADVLQRLH